MKTYNKNNNNQKNSLRISAALLTVWVLISCQANLSRTQPEIEIQPSSQNETPIEISPQPQFSDPGSTPSSAVFTTSGIDPGETLAMYQDPNTLSHLVGEIPSFGINLTPESNIHHLNGTNWIKIHFNDQSGWVDFSYLAEQHGMLPDELIKLGQTTLSALKSYQIDQLAEIIHPDLCLRFSPYSYLSSRNQVICSSEIANVAESSDVLLWGSYDGKGDPINLTFREYYNRFVYDQAYFQAPVIGFNIEMSSGNSINNLQDIYPDGMMIEYYFPGFDPQYGGMDWRSLRLVFVQKGMDWYLAALIHGEWTI